MTNEEIKADIVEACREFQAAGYRLTAETFTTKKDKAGVYQDVVCGGCAAMAVAVMRCGLPITAHVIDDVLPAIKKRYGWESLIGFVDGFDALAESSRKDEPLYKLGRAVRAAVLP